ncbi:MAG: peroxidase family protein [Paracoccaceae bacterium]
MTAMDGSIDVFREVAAEGSVSAPLRRLTESAYVDGLSAPTASNADAAEVAFTVFTQGDVDLENPFGLSALWIFWGQFLDHDLSLTPEQEGAEAELLKFAPPFNVVRSEAVEDTGLDTPREQANAITPLIDASNVYGSDAERLAALRAADGRLKTASGPDGAGLLPDADTVFGAGTEEEGLIAGDVRAMENIALTAVHSVWVNEHNYWAARFALEEPGWTDDQIFESARAAVEMLIQRITYEEFLPILLGDAVTPYVGFDPEVDPQISTEFATAAYRFGHTSIPDTLTFLEEDGEETRAALPLFDAFETADPLLEDGISPVLRGLLEEKSQAIDTKVVDSLNFLLFTPDGGLTGFSLPERNMLRGRDHGIDTYLQVRDQVLGDVDATALTGSTDFSIITSDRDLQSALAEVYQTVDQVDLWVGGLAEDHVPGLTMGPTNRAILAEQFIATRAGDPFWHETRNWADPYLYEELAATRFADVLMRSGGIDHVQGDAFLASNRTGGDEAADYLRGDSSRDLMIGGRGDDVLRGDGGDDDLFGDTNSDKLKGGSGGDALHGGADRDKLVGGSGDDTLAGGDGDDMLTGGAGADRYVFVAGEGGVDTVTDFVRGEDLIVLEGFRAETADLYVVAGEFVASLEVNGIAIAYLWGLGPVGLGEEDVLLIG